MLAKTAFADSPLRGTQLLVSVNSKPCCGLRRQAQRQVCARQVRDITQDERWFAAYQYEIPVLAWLTPEGQEVRLRAVSHAP